jgi:arginyl-tRNA--protein-N-Asp/Glu arginylyltransferase
VDRKFQTYLPPASDCSYLPDRLSRLEYRVYENITPDEYLEMVRSGWRRFGNMLFRPRCPACTACQPIRTLVSEFQPDRSQRRVEKANHDTRLVIRQPILDQERVELYYRHHAHHAEQKGWPDPDVRGGIDHCANIINGPFPVEEWDYYVGDRLVAVGYIDRLAEGYSGIYFYHDPEFRDRSLGNWICLTLIQQAKLNGMPYVYFGYFIAGCRSMEYKGRFGPNQVLDSDGQWKPFRG